MKTQFFSTLTFLVVGVASLPAAASGDTLRKDGSSCVACADNGKAEDTGAALSAAPVPSRYLELQLARARELAEQGRFQEALAQLGTLQNLEEAAGSRLGEILNLAGALHLATGSSAEADLELKDAEKGARQSRDFTLLANVLNNQAIYRLQQNDPRTAISLVEEGLAAAGRAGNIEPAAKLYVTYANALLDIGDADAEGKMAIAHRKHLALPPSRARAKGLAVIGDWYLELAVTVRQPEASALVERAKAAYADAVKTAVQQDDGAAASYASGRLGRACEIAGQDEDALRHTRFAIFHAQQNHDPSQLLYLWQWQGARLLRKQGQLDQAIGLNRVAVQTLQANKQLMASSQGWDFETEIKPVYLNLAEMLLLKASASREPRQVQDALREVLQTVELLRSDELKDYLRDPCLPTGRSLSRGVAGKDVALVHYLVLGERVEVLVENSSDISRFTVSAPVSEINDQAWLFRTLIEDRDENYLQVSQRLYDLLVRPLEPVISGSATVAIVPDGAVRTIPMAALHDGSGFLIERHALELAQVDVPLAEPSGSQHRNVLLGGISGKVPGYRQIPFVEQELRDIQQVYGGTVVKNDSFTPSSLVERMKNAPYQVLHIASHGIFTGDVSDSYLLAWGGKLRLDQLGSIAGMSRYSNAPLDLLVLSACSTAAGDERASLGLAGVAVKAGARNAIASLWDVDDESTAGFFASFYRIMKQHPSLHKAEVLRRAQLQMLRKGRGAAVRRGDDAEPAETSVAPYYWAPFVLVSGSI